MNLALFNVISAVTTIQKYVRKALKVHRNRKALRRMNKFVLGYHFEQVKELFYHGLFEENEKNGNDKEV